MPCGIEKVKDLIELRKRVLSSGFVVLESRYLVERKTTYTGGFFSKSKTIYHIYSGWTMVPYVDANGSPINNPADKIEKG